MSKELSPIPTNQTHDKLIKDTGIGIIYLDIFAGLVSQNSQDATPNMSNYYYVSLQCSQVSLASKKPQPTTTIQC